MTHETPKSQDDQTPPAQPAAPAPAFGRIPAPAQVDAAIERHRTAHEELQRATRDVDAADAASKRAEEEADAAFAAASVSEGAAFADLIATRPVDMEGAVRLLRYVSGSPAGAEAADPGDLLRQLTEAVEAAEAGEGPASNEADPMFAVAAEFRSAFDAFGATIDARGGTATGETEAAEAVHDAAYERLRVTRPTTAAGFRALAETWAWRLGRDGGGETLADHAADSLIAGAGVCVPVDPHAEVSPALADLIARHHTALARADDAGSRSDEEAGALDDEAWDLFRQACAFPVACVADLAAKLALAAPEISDSFENGRSSAGEHAWACLRADLMRTGALEALAKGAPATVVDWHSPPPGFMASPAIEPTNFAHIPDALRIDLERLHRIASAEFDRRIAGLRDRQGEAAAQARMVGIRGDLFLPALTAAIDPNGRGAAMVAALVAGDGAAPDELRMVAGGVHRDDGTVTYWDAGGKPWRHGMAHWIEFVLAQVYHRARMELCRRRQGYGDRSREEIEVLEAKASREVRFDALHVLTHHPDRAAAAAEFLRTTISSSAPLAAGPDPVHALITAHRTAYAEWDRLSDAWTDVEPGAPGYAAAQAASDAPGRREVAAYDALFVARPTTLAGVLALAEYLGEAVRRTRINAEPMDSDRALATVADGLRGLALPGEASVDPDAVLIGLGAEFLRAWVAEVQAGDAQAATDTDANAAAAEAVYGAVNAVCERIALAPATTVAGLGIKALLLGRLHSGGSTPLAPEPPQGPIYSKWNVLRQVQEGAARLVGAASEPLPPAQLVAAIEAEWAAYAKAEATGAGADEAALTRRDALIDAADLLPATSTEARHAKALALAWIVADDRRGGAPRGDIATDGRLATGVHASFANAARRGAA